MDVHIYTKYALKLMEYSPNSSSRVRGSERLVHRFIIIILHYGALILCTTTATPKNHPLTPAVHIFLISFYYLEIITLLL